MKIQRTFEMNNASDTTKFMLGVLRELRMGTIDKDEAAIICKAVDTTVKLNVARMGYEMNRSKLSNTIDFLESDSQLAIESSEKSK